MMSVIPMFQQQSEGGPERRLPRNPDDECQLVVFIVAGERAMWSFVC